MMRQWFMKLSLINQVIKNKVVVLLAVLTALALILRLIFSGYLGSFWFDEYFGVYFAREPLFKMLGLLVKDTNLPFYNILLWLWIRFFGEAETTVRLLSIILALANLPLLYLVGRRLFSKTAALTAILIYCFSPYQIFLTTEARSYSLLIFLSLLSVFFFWRLVEGRLTAGHWLGFVASNLLLAYTHLTGGFLIIAQLIYLVLKFWRQKKILWSCFKAYLLLAFLTLPYLVFFYLSKKQTLGTIYHFLTSYDFNYFITPFAEMFADLNNPAFYIIAFNFLFPFFILGSLVVVKKIGNRRKLKISLETAPAGGFAWLLLVVFLAGGFAFHLTAPRYAALISVFVYLLIGQGIENWFKGLRWIKIIIVVLAPLIIISSLGSFFVVRDRWPRVDSCLRQLSHPEAKIIVHNFAYELILRKYYQGNLPIEGFYPVADDLSYGERIVLSNGRPVVNRENVGQLAEVTAGYDQIAMVEAIFVKELDPDSLVFRWFLDNGWTVEDDFCQVEGIRVFNFNRLEKDN